MKCQENNCEHYKDDCWCEIFDEYTKCMNCYGAFKPKGDDVNDY